MTKEIVIGGNKFVIEPDKIRIFEIKFPVNEVTFTREEFKKFCKENMEVI